MDEATPLTRASKDGPVAGDLTYEKWLKGRSVAEQDDLLGKTRGAAFRANKLSLDDLYRDDGREYTLKELRARHPTAF